MRKQSVCRDQADWRMPSRYRGRGRGRGKQMLLTPAATFVCFLQQPARSSRMRSLMVGICDFWYHRGKGTCMCLRLQHIISIKAKHYEAVHWKYLSPPHALHLPLLFLHTLPSSYVSHSYPILTMLLIAAPFCAIPNVMDRVVYVGQVIQYDPSDSCHYL